MPRVFILLLCLLCTGCGELRSLEQPETRAWLTLHTVDTLQTWHAAQQPECYAENNPTTRALIGEHPSNAGVVAWSAASVALHLGVTEWLLRHDHPRIAKAWQYFSIADTGHAIAKNYSLGIRIGSPNETAGWCRAL